MDGKSTSKENDRDIGAGEGQLLEILAPEYGAEVFKVSFVARSCRIG